MIRYLFLLLLSALASKAAGLGPFNPAQHAVNGFMPTQLRGLSLWLDANRLGLTNNAKVDVCLDFSGTSNNATNSTGTQQPLLIASAYNGRSAMRFDGVDDILYCKTSALKTNAIGFLCFVAWQRTTNTTAQAVVGQRTAGTKWRWVVDYNQDDNGIGVQDRLNAFFEGGSSGSGNSGYAINLTNNPPVILFVANNSGGSENAKLYSKGTQFESFTIAGAQDTNTTIGGSYSVTGFNGDIAEVVFGTNAMTDFQVVQLQRYLGTKYGIVVK